MTFYGLYGQSLLDRHLVMIASLSFWVSTFLLSPDLDLKHSIPTKNWGVLKVIWRGYSKFFRHRGKSHSLLFSSVTKLLYLAGVAFISLCLYEVAFHWVVAPSWAKTVSLSKEAVVSILYESCHVVIHYKYEFLAAFCGLVLNDWTHILSDRVYSLLRSKGWL